MDGIKFFQCRSGHASWNPGIYRLYDTKWFYHWTIQDERIRYLQFAFIPVEKRQYNPILIHGKLTVNLIPGKVKRQIVLREVLD